MKQVRRVAIWPIEVAGYASRLADALAAGGMSVDLVILDDNPFQYATEAPPGRLVLTLQRVRSKRLRTGGLPAALWGASELLLRLALVLKMGRPGSLIVCVSGRSILRGLDCRYARLMGACVISVFLGTDSRPPWMNGVIINADEPWEPSVVAFKSALTAKAVKEVEDRSTWVVCNPASAQFLRRPFINWFSVGMPVEEAPLRPRDDSLEGGELVALHAPTRPRQKGTALIEATVNTLRNEGVKIRLHTLTGVPNHEVRAALLQADFVIDEMYSDAFLGGLGVEAASVGVPALTFGYAEGLFKNLADSCDYPLSGYREPEELDTALRQCYEDRKWLADVTHQQRAFIADRWSSQAVAASLLDIAVRGPRPETIVDPMTVDYFLGFGVPRMLLYEAIERLVSTCGLEALCLPPSSSTFQAVQCLIESDQSPPTCRKGTPGHSA